jgi:succinyl-CoA synthetase beta subunit
MTTIEMAIANKQQALSEYHSKKYLSTFGVPITREQLVQSVDEAVKTAEAIGFPVALKACSPELMHKSETGCIELGLTTPEAVQQAFILISEKIQVSLEGILVQEMIKGPRELVVGLTRDPQFGPCVMLGFGGVMTEVLKDTVFRVAPFDKIEAMDMIDELQSRTMLDAFRGQQPADLDMICQTLISVGQIGLQQKSIAEIDINPLIVSPNGQVKAADALIILERK